ncbi:hypothetical protein Ancab_011803 [Ancistrocladus abbreviatus]
MPPWFGKLHPWSKQDTGANRAAWLTCVGIPLHVYHEEFFSSLARRWGTLTAIDGETSQWKRFDIARIAVQTQQSGFIQAKVNIKVDEDDFLITVAEDSVHDVDRRGDEAHDLKGAAHIDSLSHISMSYVSDSFEHHITGDHFPDLVSSPQKIITNAQCQLDVTSRLINSGEISKKHKGKKMVQAHGCALRSKDSPHSDALGPSGNPSLGFSSKAHPQFSSIEVHSNGSGDKGADLAGPIAIGKPSTGLLCPSVEPLQLKLVSRSAKHAQKKHMEDILQLRLSKRVIRKEMTTSMYANTYKGRIYNFFLIDTRKAGRLEFSDIRFGLLKQSQSIWFKRERLKVVANIAVI